jgi:hypothetical protein
VYAQDSACDAYIVSFVPTTVTEGQVNAVRLSAGEEPFGITLVPGQVPPYIAVRSCTP